MKKLMLIFFMALLGLTGTYAQSSSDFKIIHLDDDTFKEKVFDYTKGGDWRFEGNKPVIVDFYADWCGPCKRLAPVLKELQKEYGNAIQIYKVDTDMAPIVSAAFGIKSIPSLLFVPLEGKPTMAQGALPKETFVKAINDILDVKAPK